MKMTVPTHVAIRDLKLDENANVRKTGTGAEAAFLANIEAKGILVPLTVRKNGTGYLVINGGKRLAALQHLAKTGRQIEGKPADAYLVPIYVRDEDDVSARDTSLASNIIVAPMHPVDRYEAFVQMIADGASEAKLQTDFAMTEKEVKQVLALGALSPKVREAWRTGKFDAEVAQAFTLGQSHKIQDKALSDVLNSIDNEWDVDADEVKEHFKLSSRDIGKTLEFVGIEEYEKSGGKVTRDLFGIDHTVSNEKLVQTMAVEKLDAVCEDLMKDGWSWAVRADTVNNRYNFGSSRVTDVKPTKEEAEEIERLKKVAGDDSGFNQNDFEQERAHDQKEALEAKIQARGYTADQKKKAGCFVSVSGNGILSIEYGRVKPQEQKAAAAVDRAVSKAKAKKEGKPVEKKINLSISNALTSELSDQLTKAVSEAIASNPSVALPAVIAGFLCSAHTKPIDVSQERHKNRAPFAATFEAAMKKKPAEQLAALALVVGPLVNMNVSHTDRGPLRDAGTLAVCEALGAPLYIALKKHFDAKAYFGSVNRHIACKQLKEMFGKGYQASWENEKKAKIEKIAITKAKETGWLPPELRTSFYAPKKAG
jgi:ParB family chromosome partitioning protein